jgi:60 kDa SS-A/Ro ribonucleoprotein
LTTYAAGKGFKGSLTWNPLQKIIDALDTAFYSSFKYVTPSGKRILMGIDISYSMFGNTVNGNPALDAATVAAAMALITLKTEKDTIIKGFSSAGGGVGLGRLANNDAGFVDLPISDRMRLDSVLQVMTKVPMGGTDCSLPMRWATQNKVPVDAFIVYTDNETWHGAIHPTQALTEYRNKMGIPAKLIVAGVCATDFSIADSNDSGMLDVAGFDSAAPQVISEFIKGDLGLKNRTEDEKVLDS